MFSSAEYSELCDQHSVCCQSDCSLHLTETHYDIPGILERGYIRSMELLPGVWLDCIDLEYGNELILSVPAHDHLIQSCLWINGLTHYNDIYPTLGGNRSYLSGSGISPAYKVCYKRFNHLIGVNIHLSPEVLKGFLAEMPDFDSELLQMLLKKEDWKVSFFPDVTLPMQRVVQQILNAPFRGVVQRMFLQAKVFELLALQLDPILNEPQQIQPSSGLKPDTIARIHQAKDILTAQLEHPPSLTDLAKQVAVSDRTLRRGFQELFGTTVVGYLTQQRMQHAEQLLRNGNCTVAEVANQVGYAHLGHFAAAFKRQFGITPRQCLAGRLSVLGS